MLPHKEDRPMDGWVKEYRNSFQGVQGTRIHSHLCPGTERQDLEQTGGMLGCEGGEEKPAGELGLSQRQGGWGKDSLGSPGALQVCCSRFSSF